MKLDDARGVKREILEKYVLPFAARANAHVLRSAGHRDAADAIAPPESPEDAEDLCHLIGISAQGYSTLPERQRTLGIGISRGENGNYRLALRLQRRSLLHSPIVERVKKAAGRDVDIEVVGRAVKLSALAPAPWHRRNCRPLEIGSSIGHINVTAGSLGGFAKKAGTDKTYILSNNHVLAHENAGNKGDPIVQRGCADGGLLETDKVGILDGFVKLETKSTNLVDCALAEITDPNGCERNLMRDLDGIGKNGRLKGVAGISTLEKGEIVRKIGRTTGATIGRIVTIELDHVILKYDMGNIRFDNQIEIESNDERLFADGGDSGSLIVDGDGKAVGLLTAMSEQGGRNRLGKFYANPIQQVLSDLKAELIY
jgi:hypothetical protein